MARLLATFLCIVLFFYPLTETARILNIVSIPSPSHYIYVSALLKELVSRGHEVTSVSVFPQEKPIKNFRDIFIENNTIIHGAFLKEVQGGPSYLNSWNMMVTMLDMTEQMTINIFEHPEIKELMKSPEDQFDLIIVEVIYGEALYGLGQHFNAPMIGVSTFGTTRGIDEVVGNMSPTSISPHTIMPYLSRMTFWQRLHNWMCDIGKYILLNFKNYYTHRKIYEKYFPNAKISFDEALTNFSLVLLNQHHTLGYPRSYVTNMIEVGGLHIDRNPPPLPEDLQEYLDNATEGVIYFSMGSNLKSKSFDETKINIFINVFKKLKLKVLWKFEDPNLPNKPGNVLIKPWLPQHSVLAHLNVKIFITHGGLLSTTEAIFCGKPMLGIPMFGDQMKNVNIAVKRGICVSLDFAKFTESDFQSAIDELLNNPSYKYTIQTISDRYHDQPMKPMELAVYWVEYILRHGGGEHLKNAGVYLNVFQFYSLDVIGFIMAIISIVAFISWKLARVLVNKLRILMRKDIHGKKTK